MIRAGADAVYVRLRVMSCVCDDNRRVSCCSAVHLIAIGNSHCTYTTYK